MPESVASFNAMSMTPPLIRERWRFGRKPVGAKRDICAKRFARYEGLAFAIVPFSRFYLFSRPPPLCKPHLSSAVPCLTFARSSSLPFPGYAGRVDTDADVRTSACGSRAVDVRRGTACSCMPSPSWIRNLVKSRGFRGFRIQRSSVRQCGREVSPSSNADHTMRPTCSQLPVVGCDLLTMRRQRELWICSVSGGTIVPRGS